MLMLYVPYRSSGGFDGFEPGTPHQQPSRSVTYLANIKRTILSQEYVEIVTILSSIHCQKNSFKRGEHFFCKQTFTSKNVQQHLQNVRQRNIQDGEWDGRGSKGEIDMWVTNWAKHKQTPVVTTMLYCKFDGDMAYAVYTDCTQNKHLFR